MIHRAPPARPVLAGGVAVRAGTQRAYLQRGVKDVKQNSDGKVPRRTGPLRGPPSEARLVLTDGWMGDG